MKELDKIIQKYDSELSDQFKSEIRAFQNEFWNLGATPTTKQILQSVDMSRNAMVNKLSNKWEAESQTSDNYNYFFNDVLITIIDIELCLKLGISFKKYLQYCEYKILNNDAVNLANYVLYFKGMSNN